MGGAAAFFAGIGASAARAACGRPSSPSVPPGGTCSHRPAMLPSSSSSSSLPRDEGAGAGARGLRCCGAGCRGADAAAGVGAVRRAASTSSAMDASVSRCGSDRLSSMAVRARSSAPAAHAVTTAAASDWRWLGECAGAAAGLWRALLGGIRAAAAAPEHAEEAPAESGDAPGATLSQRPAMPPASSKSSMCVLYLGLRGHAQTGARAMRASRSTRGGVKTEHYTRNQTDSNKRTASRSAEGKNVSGPPPRCVRCSFRNTPTPCSTYKGVCPVRMAVSLGAALGRNDEDARPTGCGAEPREIFLPFLLQNRPFSKEILTFRTPL